MMTRLLALVIVAALGGCGGGGATAKCGDGHLDPGEECDDGPMNGFDGVCTMQCMKNIVHTTLTANVGINRDIVPEYAGDACQSVAKLLVIEGTDPNGAALPHQEVDCTMGYNGWPYYDVPPGTSTVAMQLWDDQGNAITPPRSTTVTVVAGSNTVAWVDFTYKDFSTQYTGNLRWQTDWVNLAVPDGGVDWDAGVTGTGVGCAEAQPPVTQMRVTLANDQGIAVHDTATFIQNGQTYTTNTGQKGDCHTYGTSDAEVVKNLPWGVYSLRVDGFDASNQATFCAIRNVFVTNGDGIIFHAHAAAEACP
jgi:cysteine-rich repeat protein